MLAIVSDSIIGMSKDDSVIHHFLTVPCCPQDIDAAYMMDGDGDLDADLSALLEVPDLNSTDLASLGPSMTPAALSSSFNQGKRLLFLQTLAGSSSRCSGLISRA